MSIVLTNGSPVPGPLLLARFFLGGGPLLGPGLSCEPVLLCSRGRFPLFLKIAHSRYKRAKQRLALSALGRNRHLDMGAARGAYLLVDLDVRHLLVPLPFAFKPPRPEVAPCQVDITFSAN